jgi:hypothetical protein
MQPGGLLFLVSSERALLSLDFSDQLLIKSGGEGQGREGHICLLKPSATASLSGPRQKGYQTAYDHSECVEVEVFLDP